VQHLRQVRRHWVYVTFEREAREYRSLSLSLTHINILTYTHNRSFRFARFTRHIHKQVPKRFFEGGKRPFGLASSLLARFGQCDTPAEAAATLLLAVKAIYAEARIRDSKQVLAADDLLPILAYVHFFFYSLIHSDSFSHHHPPPHTHTRTDTAPYLQINRKTDFFLIKPYDLHSFVVDSPLTTKARI